MRNHLLRSLAALGLLLWTVGTAQAAESMAWAKSYSDAAAVAKSGNRLIMVDFYTDWCHWCKVLDKETYTDSRVIALSRRLVPVKINAEKEGVAQAKKYHITGYPTILFLTADGAVAGKIVGYQAAAAFADSMTNFITTHKEMPGLLAALAKNPNDSATAAKLAPMYTGKGDAEKTLAMIKIVEDGDAKNAALPTLYNALGDLYQNNAQYDLAIAQFSKAAAAAKTGKELAYARLSVAYCHLGQNKLAEAVPELEAVIALPDAPADLVKMAKDTLPQVKAALDKK